MPLRQPVPDRSEAGYAVAEPVEHDPDHGQGREALDDELAEVGERVGPQPADGAVQQRDHTGDQDAGRHGHTGEHVEQDRHRRPFRGDVEDLEQGSAPRERLLGGDVVPLGEVLQRRGHGVPTPQPVPARGEQPGTDAGAEGERQERPDVDGDPVAVGDGRVGDEHGGAVAGHVVGDAGQPPGHPAAAGEVVADVTDAPVRPETDEQHHQEVAAQGGPVESGHERSSMSCEGVRRGGRGAVSRLRGEAGGSPAR